MNIIGSTHFMISWLLINFLLSTYATSTLNTSQMLITDNGDTVISPKGTSEMGFFTPDGSTNQYVGIWYKKITPRTVVWIANRNNPLRDRSGMLRVVEPGIIVLFAATNDSFIWSTNTSARVQTPVAEFLDSGNLVVRDANDKNPENFLWQSFDYPTDTLMPGMKLGKNFVTGSEVYLTSKKSDNDPSPADYTFHFDPTGYPQFLVKKGDIVMSRGGPWSFNGLSRGPRMNAGFFYANEVLNEREVYYRYDLINNSFITMFTLSVSGVAERWVWNEKIYEWVIYSAVPIDHCDVYNVCGPYGRCNINNSPLCGCLDKFKAKDPQGQKRGDWSSGCVRSRPLNCEKGDRFLKYPRMKLPDTQNSSYNTSIDLEECEGVCLKNCSCTAYTTLDITTGVGCLLWFDDLVDMREISPGQDIYIRMASPELDTEESKRKILIVTLPLVAGILLLSMSLFLLLYFWKRRKLDHQLIERDLELPMFNLSIITKATDNFSINNKLGEGGFGPVYKGLKEDGQVITVKRLSKTSLQGLDEFKNEVICIAKLQHRNLVKLLGWCIQREELMLVYEYMPNKSLDLILFDPTKCIQLDWPRRFNIIIGIARGLLYLHHDSRLRVIHRDLKASNILLDSDMNAKISDFGLARTFGGNETGANTNRIVGTYGYMSPEYAGEGLFSVKSDVFSFGVIMLEIVSGKRNRRFSYRDHDFNILGHPWMHYKEEKSLELLDSCLRNLCNVSQVLRSIHVGLLCVQEHPNDRPTMSSVAMMLTNDVVLPQPKLPGFFTQRDLLETNILASSSPECSRNRITTSLLHGR